jgi:hypothetical protein
MSSIGNFSRRLAFIRGLCAVKLGLLFLALLPPPTNALIGNIPGVPCLVACGGSKGVVNFGFVGDATRNLFFDSSINRISDKFDALGAKYSQQFSDILDGKINEVDKRVKGYLLDLGKIVEKGTATLDEISRRATRDLDASLQRRTQELTDSLSNVSNEAINKLDATLKENIERLATETSKQQGEIRATFEQQQNRFSKTLLASVVFFVLCLAGLAALITVRHAPQQKLVAISSFGGFSLVVLLAGAVLHQQNTKSPVPAWEKLRDTSFLAENWVSTIAYSQAVLAIEPENRSAIVMNRKYLLLRDVSLRPTVLLDKKASNFYTKQLLESLSEIYDVKGQVDADILYFLHMFLTSLGDDRFAEYASASIAAELIGRKEKIGISDAKVRRLRYSVLSYLQNPIEDDVVRSVYGSAIALTSNVAIPFQTINSLKLVGQSVDVQLMPDDALRYKLRALHLENQSIAALVFNNSILNFAHDSSYSDEWLTTLDSIDSGIARIESVVQGIHELSDTQEFQDAPAELQRQLLTFNFRLLGESLKYLKTVRATAFVDTGEFSCMGSGAEEFQKSVNRVVADEDSPITEREKSRVLLLEKRIKELPTQIGARLVSVGAISEKHIGLFLLSYQKSQSEGLKKLRTEVEGLSMLRFISEYGPTEVSCTRLQVSTSEGSAPGLVLEEPSPTFKISQSELDAFNSMEARQELFNSTALFLRYQKRLGKGVDSEPVSSVAIVTSEMQAAIRKFLTNPQDLVLFSRRLQSSQLLRSL